MITIGINGFGRIGRIFFRMAAEDPSIAIRAINDPFMDLKHMEYLIKYDTVHGRFKGEISRDDGALIVNGTSIKVLEHKNPDEIPWAMLGVDYVIECTGVFTSYTSASRHLTGGAKRVVISAPSDTAPHFVVGVNHEEYNPKLHTVVSNASCTTNCLAPLVKIVHDEYGIKEGVLTTVHSVTSTQKTVDCPSGKDWRSGRCSLQNIIPATTGATSSVIKVIPDLKGKLTGMCFRVPLANVSVVDLTCRIKKSASLDEIRNHIKKMSESKYIGIMGYTDDEVVSSDFVSDPRSCIFDAGASIALNENFVKLVGWYDNEAGYSKRLVDLIKYMDSREK